jgi:hypothetical protein
MGAWTEIVDFTFTANETSRAFTGLNITKDDFIKVVFHLKDGSGGGSNAPSLYPNTAAGVSGFNTTTNYHRQVLVGTDTTVGASRNNINIVHTTTANDNSTMIGYIKISENGKFNIFTNRTDRDSSTLNVVFDYTTSSNLTFNDPITSLTFSTVTNGLGNGSRIQIYRLDAEKVADITVTSNSTQVDIPVTGSLDPAITKDSEYLLVSDILNNSTGFPTYRLMVNDNTTITDYHSQRIGGNGSTTFATRFNDPLITTTAAGSRVMIYSHIKLSEIGAYTSQNYGIGSYGSTEPVLQNAFVSSTAENITSITKLNVGVAATDGLGSGSRFILYKLK